MKTQQTNKNKDNKLIVKELSKEVIQSYLFTASKYRFSVHEKRIIYRIIESLQVALSGKKLDKGFEIQANLFNGYEFQIPISYCLPHKDSTNYEVVKEALFGLNNRSFEVEDNKSWRIERFIESPSITKGEKMMVKFKLPEEIAKYFLDFSQGYSKYDLTYALSFTSVYAMRFYEIIANQTNPIQYKIEKLKNMFDLGQKYKLTADFIKRVIDVAKAELDEKSPVSFTYKKITLGKKVTDILFFPYFTEHHGATKIKKEQNMLESLIWSLSTETVNYLTDKEKFNFTTDEIKRNRELFVEADNKFDLVLFCEKKYVKCSNLSSPKGYLINAIKSELKSKEQSLL